MHIPVGFGVQVNENIFGFVETDIAQIEISDSDSGFIFADFLPLNIGAFFSPSNTMDFGGQISWFDLSDAADYVTIVGMARLHM